jgi:hypothetical protein
MEKGVHGVHCDDGEACLTSVRASERRDSADNVL